MKRRCSNPAVTDEVAKNFDLKKGLLTAPALQVYISPTFVARLFRTKVSRQAFLYLHFRFELILAQEYWSKCAHKMLMKLTTGVHFTYNIRAAFAPYYYAKKVQT